MSRSDPPPGTAARLLPGPFAPPVRRGAWLAIAALACAVLGLLALLAWRDHRAAGLAWRERLLAIAASEQAVLSVWVRERIADGRVVAALPTVRGWMGAGGVPGLDAERHLLGVLAEIKRAYGYDGVWLLGADGRPRLRVGAPHVREQDLQSLAQRVLASPIDPTATHLNAADGRVALAFLVPIRRDGGDGSALGAVALFADPAAQLWPILDRVTSAARTGETMLVEQRDGALRVLSPPRGAGARHGEAIAPSPALRAALERDEVVEGQPDSRGVPVIATARAIPGTDWSLVVTVDRDEVYAPWHDVLWMLGGMGLFLLLAVGGVGVAIARREDAQHLVAELAREREVGQERERAEADVRRLNARLEEHVRSRTAQIEAANRELDAFNYSVSHDLRAPLRHIDGFLRIRLEDHGAQLPGDVKATVGRVLTTCGRMQSLIASLLELSRLGRHDVQREPVDMGVLARCSFADLRPAAGRDIALAVGELPTALGDPLLLRALFDNLLGNAVKFTATRAHAHIEVAGETDGGFPHFSVRDDGVGFDPTHGHKLFEAFQRLHSRDDFEGTGLGLSIVKRIVDKHGGRVWAEGGIDGGATFHFTLPIAPPAAAGLDAAAAAPAA